MRGRPLCVVSLFFILFVVLCYSGDETIEPDVYDGEKRVLSCELEQIDDGSDTVSLLVGDVCLEGEPFCDRMKLYISDDMTDMPSLHIGNLLEVCVSVYSFSTPGNPGQFNEYRYYIEQGISYRGFVNSIEIENNKRDIFRDAIYRFRGRCISHLNECCNEENAGVLSAMILGVRSGLSDDIKELYQENGISHVLAISGLHISLIGAGIFFFLRRYVMPMQVAVFVTATFLVSYGVLTGFSISSKRAIIMMLCMIFARFFGKHYDLFSALALSGCIQLAFYPLSIYQSAFLLSYGTVFGIAFFVSDLKDTPSASTYISGSILGSVGIQLVTLPIILNSYYEVPLYSVLVNMLLLPMLGALVLSSIAGILVAFFSYLFAKFCFGLSHYCLLLFRIVCDMFSHFPYHTIILGAPKMWQILVYYGLLLLWCILHRIYPRWTKIALLVIPLSVICLPTHKVNDLTITSLDVGQGDCACIRTSDATMLVDGGSSDVSEVARYRIVPYLKSQGIRRIDYIFVTHSDADHICGIQEILEDEDLMGLSIGKIVLPYIEKKDENFIEFVQLCQDAHVTVAYMCKGDRIDISDLSITCLHPYASYDWDTENDYSLTLQLAYGDFCGLMMGDLEAAGEEELYGLEAVDYLKVGHHGSKGSSSDALLDQITPDVAVISVGEDNTYGHPSAEALERLSSHGADIYTTMDSGAITVKTDGEDISVTGYKEK